MLVIPNLSEYSKLLGEGFEDSARRPAAQRVLVALLAVLASMRDSQGSLANGYASVVTDDLRSRLAEKVGDFIAGQIASANEVQLAHLLVDSEF